MKAGLLELQIGKRSAKNYLRVESHVEEFTQVSPREYWRGKGVMCQYQMCHFINNRRALKSNKCLQISTPFRAIGGNHRTVKLGIHLTKILVVTDAMVLFG